MKDQSKKLATLSEYRQMSPRAQGYVAYMEADWPGSELKGNDSNPYPPGTEMAEQWENGQALAVQYAQDSEE